MKFNPNNVQPKPEGNFILLIPGVCDFYVIDAVEKTGQYGEYIELNLKLKDSAGSTTEVTTFLSADEKSLWKTQEFMIEIGQEAMFNAGDINVAALASPRNKGKCMLQHKEFVLKKDGSIKLGNHIASFAERTNIPATWTLNPDAISNAQQQLTQTTGKTAKVQEFCDDVPF